MVPKVRISFKEPRSIVFDPNISAGKPLKTLLREVTWHKNFTRLTHPNARSTAWDPKGKYTKLRNKWRRAVLKNGRSRNSEKRNPENPAFYTFLRTLIHKQYDSLGEELALEALSADERQMATHFRNALRALDWELKKRFNYPLTLAINVALAEQLSTQQGQGNQSLSQSPSPVPSTSHLPPPAQTVSPQASSAQWPATRQAAEIARRVRTDRVTLAIETVSADLHKLLFVDLAKTVDAWNTAARQYPLGPGSARDLLDLSDQVSRGVTQLRDICKVTIERLPPPPDPQIIQAKENFDLIFEASMTLRRYEELAWQQSADIQAQQHASSMASAVPAATAAASYWPQYSDFQQQSTGVPQGGGPLQFHFQPDQQPPHQIPNQNFVQYPFSQSASQSQYPLAFSVYQVQPVDQQLQQIAYLHSLQAQQLSQLLQVQQLQPQHRYEGYPQSPGVYGPPPPATYGVSPAFNLFMPGPSIFSGSQPPPQLQQGSSSDPNPGVPRPRSARRRNSIG